MRIVYYHIDELARDSIVASVLKKELKKRGIDLIYGNRFSMRFLSSLRFADLVILPSLGHFQAVFPDNTDLPKNILIFPAEAVGQATGHLRRMNAKYFGNDEKKSSPWHNAVKAFLLWGYDHLRLFKEQHPEYIEKCKVVGHPRLDSRCLKKREKNTSLKKKKIKVGFVSRFSNINTYHSISNFESIFRGMKRDGIEFPTFENSPDRDVEDYLYTEMVDFRLILKIIDSMDLTKFEVFLRPYPRENRFNWHKLVESNKLDLTISAWDEPFASWLSEMDFIISPPSTIFYEALSVGHSPICTMDIVANRKSHVLTESDDNNQILKYVRRPKTIDALLALLNEEEQFNLHPDVEKILLGQTASDIASSSITNLADACEKLIDQNIPSAKVKYRKIYVMVYKITTFSLSYIQHIRNFFVRGGEQGSTFALTRSRSRMIDFLSN